MKYWFSHMSLRYSNSRRRYPEAELENASHELSHLEHELSRDQIKQRALALQEKLSQLTARRYELEEEAGGRPPHDLTPFWSTGPFSGPMHWSTHRPQS